MTFVAMMTIGNATGVATFIVLVSVVLSVTKSQDGMHQDAWRLPKMRLILEYKGVEVDWMLKSSFPLEESKDINPGLNQEIEELKQFCDDIRDEIQKDKVIEHLLSKLVLYIRVENT